MKLTKRISRVEISYIFLLDYVITKRIYFSWTTLLQIVYISFPGARVHIGRIIKKINVRICGKENLILAYLFNNVNHKSINALNIRSHEKKKREESG